MIPKLVKGERLKTSCVVLRRFKSYSRHQLICFYGVVWPIISGFRPDDAGSNPARSTNSIRRNKYEMQTMQYDNSKTNSRSGIYGNSMYMFTTTMV